MHWSRAREECLWALWGRYGPAARPAADRCRLLAQIILDGLGRPIVQGHTHAGHVMAIFMCQSDPGMCDEWSPTAGGNRALLFPSETLRPIPAPEPDDGEGVLRLGVVNAVSLVSSPSADYFSALEEWGNRSGNSLGHVLGQLGGQPEWLQADETPTCPTCSQYEPGRAVRGGTGSRYGHELRRLRHGVRLRLRALHPGRLPVAMLIDDEGAASTNSTLARGPRDQHHPYGMCARSGT